MATTITRRALATSLAAGTLAAVATARAADLQSFRIGISAPVVSILPVFLADSGGFYKKYGLDAQIISAEGGTRGLQVLLSGEIKVMHVGLAPVVQANAQGADLRMIAATTNTLPITVFARKKTNPSLPKGSAVGVSTFGSETDVAMTVALRKLGMTRSDVSISQLGGTTQRYAAMLAGRIEAAPLLEPTITLAREKGFVPLVDLAAEHTPWIFDGVVVTSDNLKSSRPILLSFLKAYIEGATRALADPAFGKQVIRTRLKVNDEAAVDASYHQFSTLMPPDAAPSIDCARNVIATLKGMNLPVGSTDPGAYVDLGPINDLKQQGFIAAMHKDYGLS
jgi:NitT/TauT family transport system substrate-binding protein